MTSVLIKSAADWLSIVKDPVKDIHTLRTWYIYFLSTSKYYQKRSCRESGLFLKGKKYLIKTHFVFLARLWDVGYISSKYYIVYRNDGWFISLHSTKLEWNVNGNRWCGENYSIFMRNSIYHKEIVTLIPLWCLHYKFWILFEIHQILCGRFYSCQFAWKTCQLLPEIIWNKIFTFTN